MAFIQIAIGLLIGAALLYSQAKPSSGKLEPKK
jgi:hypothetical protein